MPVSPIQVTVRDYLRILGQRKKWIILCILAGLFGFLGYSYFFMKRVYEARADVEIIQPAGTGILKGRSGSPVSSRLMTLIKKINLKANKKELMNSLLTQYWVGEKDSLKAHFLKLNQWRRSRKRIDPKIVDDIEKRIINIIENKAILSRPSEIVQKKQGRDVKIIGWVENSLASFIQGKRPMKRDSRTYRELMRFFREYEVTSNLRYWYKRLKTFYKREEDEKVSENFKSQMRNARVRIAERLDEMRMINQGTAALLTKFVQGMKISDEEYIEIENTFREKLLNFSEDKIDSVMNGVYRNLEITHGGVRKGSDFLTIVFRSGDPHFTVDVIDHVYEMLIVENGRYKEEEVDRSINVLRKQVEEYFNDMVNIQDRIEKFERESLPVLDYGSLDEFECATTVEKPQPIMIRTREYYRKRDEIKELERKRTSLVNKIQDLRQDIAREPDFVVGETLYAYDEEVRSIKKKLASLHAEMASYADASEEHPIKKQKKQEIDYLTRLLKDKDAIRVEQQEKKRNPNKDKFEDQLRATVSELRDVESTIAAYESDLKALPGEIKNLITKQSEYNKLRMELRRNQELHAAFSGRLKQAVIRQRAESAEGTSFKLINKPSVPTRPVKPNFFLMGLMGFIIGIFASATIVLVLEFADHSVRDIEDARRFIEAPVLGTISDFEFQKKEASRTRLSGPIKIMVVFILIVLGLVAVANYPRIKNFFEGEPEIPVYRLEEPPVPVETGIATGVVPYVGTSTAAPVATSTATPPPAGTATGVSTGTGTAPVGPPPRMSGPAASEGKKIEIIGIDKEK